MTQVNIYDTAIELFTEAKEESKRAATTVELMRLNNVSLIKKFDELDIYCDHIEGELKQAKAATTDTSNLTTRLMAVSNAVESLTDDNVELQGKLKQSLNESLNVAGLNKKIAEQSIEIKSLAAYKRKAEVLARDLKLSEANYQKARAKQLSAPSQPKPMKPVKKTSYIKQLEKEIHDRDEHILELMKWAQVSPRYGNTLQHSTQGQLDVIDLKVEESLVSEVDGGNKRVEKRHRLVVVNQSHSMKMITLVPGESELNKTKVAKGKTVQLDDEVLDHLRGYLKDLSDLDGHIETQSKILKQQRGRK